jgi:hypothetical protein
MICLECAQGGVQTPAVAICHSCSAALCLEHAEIVPQYLKVGAPGRKSLTLPIAARSILCRTCRTAVEQPRVLKTA